MKLNGSEITFNDIPDLLSKSEVDVEGYGKAIILHIDTKKADKTTKQHGLAWWVQSRAVGQCKWSRSDYERILDGRTSEAKRFTFIVQADYLKKYTRVDGFVLGDKIEYGENEPTTHGEEVKISPLLYETILIRAEKRLLSLHGKVKDAPFLLEQQEALNKFLERVEVVQEEFVEVAVAGVK